MYFRTKCIKGIKHDQLVKSYRNEEGQNRAKDDLSLEEAQF
jgi:hypothetical protein